MESTFVDLGLFGGLSAIFTFILIFVIVYGLLTVQRLFKVGDGEKGLYALIALSTALLATFSGVAVEFIAFLTPWFTVFIIFIFFVFFIFRMWAGDDENYFQDALKNNNGLRWTLIVVAILILIAALSNTFGQGLLEGNPEIEGQPQQQVVDTDGTSFVQVDATNSATGQVDDGRVYSADGGVSSNSGAAQNPTSATATASFSDNVLATLTHPKILGLILIMLIAFFTILFLARNNDPDA
mgnify:CR=1 FL=1